MVEHFDRASDVYEWNVSFFVILGVWPLQTTYLTFIVWIVYLLLHLTMEFSDLYQVFGNLELMIFGLSELTLEIMIFVKMFMYRFSKKLMDLMIRITNSGDSRLFESTEEKEIYLNYNRIAKTYFKVWTTMGAVACIMYHMKPLEFRLKAVLRNESIPFVLPYHTRLFFDVNDSTTFWLVWIFQLPMVYIHIFHSVTIAFLFSLVLHVSGQLSVLAFRIRNIDVSVSKNGQETNIIFRDIVDRHETIMRTARDIDEVFHIVLLEELIVSTVIIGLTSFSLILNADLADKGVFLSFFLYCSTMLVLIYGYCVAGEYLIVESTTLYQAFYQFQWYNESNSFKKQLQICMIGASRPLQLTAGGYYTFSLVSFTGILKTAMGYLSMLRKVVE